MDNHFTTHSDPGDENDSQPLSEAPVEAPEQLPLIMFSNSELDAFLIAHGLL